MPALTETPNFELEHKFFTNKFLSTPKNIVIAIDFDGTIVEHDIQRDDIIVPYAKETILKIQNHGIRWILYTMRHGPSLEEAKQTLWLNGLIPWAVNNNPDQTWSKSPKVYANIYIDDCALGVPMVNNGFGEHVDWREVHKLLFGHDIVMELSGQ